jgi:hypothetical protein
MSYELAPEKNGINKVQKQTVAAPIFLPRLPILDTFGVFCATPIYLSGKVFGVLCG